MAYSKEALLAEARRRGLIGGTQPAVMPVAPVMRRPTQEQLFAEAARRGLIPARYTQPAPQIAPVQQREEPGVLEGYVANPIARGYNRLEQAANVAGAMTGILSPSEFAENYAANERDIQGYALPAAVERGTQEIMRSEGFWDTAGALWENPAAVLNTATESLVQSAPTLGLGAAGALAGSVVGPAGAAAGLAGGVGMGSGITEYLATIGETMAEEGIDTTDPAALEAAIQNPEFMEKAKDRALKRGVAVGVFDAISGGIAGRVGRPVYSVVNKSLRGGRVGRVAGATAGAGAEIGIQGTTGAMGEAAAQIATDGQITSPGAVGLEFAAELVPGAGEAAIGMATQRPTLDDQPDLLQREKEKQEAMQEASSRFDVPQQQYPTRMGLQGFQGQAAPMRGAGLGAGMGLSAGNVTFDPSGLQRQIIPDPYAQPGGFTMPEEVDPDFRPIEPRARGPVDAEYAEVNQPLSAPEQRRALVAPLRGLPRPEAFGRRTMQGDGFTATDPPVNNAPPVEDVAAEAVSSLPAGRRIGVQTILKRTGLKAPEQGRQVLQALVDRGIVQRKGKAWVRSEQSAARREFRQDRPIKDFAVKEPVIEGVQGVIEELGSNDQFPPRIGVQARQAISYNPQDGRGIISAGVTGPQDSVAKRQPAAQTTPATPRLTEPAEQTEAPEAGDANPEGATIAQPSDLDYERARMAYAWNSFSPEKRATDDQRSYADDVNGLYDDLLPVAETDEQKAILRREVERYAQNYRDRYGKVLDAKGRTASPAVTGPARFPTERNRKRMDAEQKRSQEFLAWRDKARKSVRAAVQGARTEEQVASDEWASFKKEIDSEFASVAARDNGTGFGVDRGTAARSLKGKIQRRADNGQVDVVRRALDYIREKQGSMERPVLTKRNSVWQLAEQAQEAQAQTEKQETAGPRTVAEFDGATIVDDAPADRTRIYFDAKPEQEVTQALRKEGWKWSRTEGAWQRKRTSSAEQSARRVVGRFYDNPAQRSDTDAREDQEAMFARRDPRVVEVNREDIGPFKGSRAWRRAAERTVRDLIGRRVPHGEMGGDVVISRSGVAHTLRNAADDLVLAATRLPDLIRTARRIGLPESDNRGRADIKAVHRLEGQVRIDGTLRSTQIVIRETNDDRFFYDLALMKEGRPQTGTESREAQVRSQSSQRATSNKKISLRGADRNADSDEQYMTRFDGMEVRPDANADARKAMRIAADTLRQLNADRHIRHVRLLDRIADGNADGYFLRGVLALALDAPDLQRTVRHEAIHALKQAGVFTEAEWAVLEKAARDKWVNEYDIGGRYDGLKNLSEEKKLEEAIADAFAAYEAGDLKAKGMIRRVFENLRRMLNAVADALGVKGLRTWEDVFRDIETGRVGARGEGRRETVGLDSVPAFRARAHPGNPINTQNQTIVDALRGTTKSALDRLRGTVSADALNETIYRWRIKFQDEFLPVLRQQQAIARKMGRAIDDAMNPYLWQEQYAGRVGKQTEDLHSKRVEPLLKQMQDAGITQAELEEYLYASHAKERNAQIAKINPEFADGEGSGMTDAEADAILRSVAEDRRRAAFESLAGQVREMLDEGVRRRIESGLMSQDQADAWREAYKNYVPLRGEAEIDADVDRPSGGQSGMSVKGQESKRAFGRKSKARDILAYSIMQAEEAIIRAEKNNVARAFYELAQAAPDKTVWEVNKISTERRVNPTTGLVTTFPTERLSAEDAPYTVTVKIDGEEHRVTMNRSNPEAVRLASAMRRLNATQLGVIMQVMSRMNRWLSSVNTTLNPEFVITNAFRDIQTAGVNLQQFDKKGLTRGVLKDYLKAMRGLWDSQYGDGKSEWAKWYDEFAKAGGRVYFNQMEDIEAQRRRLQRAMKDMEPGTNPMKLMRQIGRHIEQVNLIVENAIRLSAYKNARQGGMSEMQAASLARNLTVNFNRKGEFGAAMNAMYLFYNASVQGSAVILNAMKHKRVQKVVSGVVVMGALMEALNSMASGDDDDGEAYYDKIPHYVKSRNMVVMNPLADDGSYLAIPMPYGYNAFYEMGRSMVALARGRSLAEAGGGLVTTIVDSFNPIGGTESLLNFISPTLVDPVVDLQRNEDFTGKPIMPEQAQYGPEVPDSSRYWNNVNPAFKWLTSRMNDLTGGDAVQAGAVDVSPETLEYLFGTFTGAAGTFWGDRLPGLPLKLLDPAADVTANDIPLYRKLVGGDPSWYDKGAFYERSNQIAQAERVIKEYRERQMPEQARAYMEENRNVLRLASLSKDVRQGLADIRNARAATKQAYDRGRIERQAFYDRLNALDAREKRLLTRFNKAWNSRIQST